MDDCAARQIFVVRRGVFPAAAHSEPSSSPHAVRPLHQRAHRAFRERGVRAFASKVRSAVGTRRVVVYRLDREQVLKRAIPVEGVTVRSLTESDIPACLAMQLPYSEDMVAARFRAGDSCLAAWRDTRVVAVRWLTTLRADVGPLGISLSVRPGIAYAYDAFTAPEERGRGIAGIVTAALFESASASGAMHVINAVLPSSSGQVLARGRSKVLGSLSARNLGRWSIVRCQMPRGYLGAPAPMGAGT
jgi:hypothetical protein